MGNLSLPTPVESPVSRPAVKPAEPQGEHLVVDFGNPVAADYAAFLQKRGIDAITVPMGARLTELTQGSRIDAIILLLGHRLSEQERRTLDAVVAAAQKAPPRFIGIVSSFRVHLHDRHAAVIEAVVLAKVKQTSARIAVFRPGNVLAPSSPETRSLRRCAGIAPLVPRRLRSCFISGDELFTAIEYERNNLRSRRLRHCTLLGPNRPWRDVLAEHQTKTPGQRLLTGISALLALLLVGQLAALLLDLLIRFNPRFCQWNFDTLRPDSLRELLALVNPYNNRFVKVVGYNNGVRHFGQRHHGKTVVSTVHCNRILRVAPDIVKADGGTTIRQALDFLNRSSQEMYVVPNFSYVCLGTAFFVPIHGSAADFSTVAETITRVILYDPVTDRVIVANRDEVAFRDHLYNLNSPVLLLRLCFRVKKKSRYFVRREELDNPQSEHLLAALRDDRATNVEIRKSQAASSAVQVSKYYQDPGSAQSPVLELPRDSLGRLWDRLEENPITAFLMHRLTRHLAWHVELFFTAEEFKIFWETHRSIPLRKIQLRYIRRDGFPHSPFREHDCVSSDMFMFRKDRQAFETYLKQTFTVVRANPGKHSA